MEQLAIFFTNPAEGVDCEIGWGELGEKIETLFVTDSVLYLLYDVNKKSTKSAKVVQKVT